MDSIGTYPGFENKQKRVRKIHFKFSTKNSVWPKKVSLLECPEKDWEQKIFLEFFVNIIS